MREGQRNVQLHLPGAPRPQTGKFPTPTFCKVRLSLTQPSSRITPETGACTPPNNKTITCFLIIFLSIHMLK